MLNQKSFNRIMFILLVFLALAVGYFQSALEAQERQNRAFQSASQD